MDMKTLYRLYYLPKMIEQKEREIQRIWDKLTAMSPSLTGMPHGGGVHDKVGDGVIELVTRKEELEAIKRGFEQEEKDINQYIDDVADIQVNLIMTYRFREKMSWDEVADSMGGVITSDACRMMCVRYLKKEEEADGQRDRTGAGRGRESREAEGDRRNL